jgi:hypothetical protein
LTEKTMADVYRVVPWRRMEGGTVTEWALVDLPAYKANPSQHDCVLGTGLSTDPDRVKELAELANKLNERLEAVQVEAMPEHGHYTITLDAAYWGMLEELAKSGREYAQRHPLFGAMNTIIGMMGKDDELQKAVEEQFTPHGLVKALIRKSYSNIEKGAGK